MKVCVFTLGCKVNRYESDCLIRLFSEKGFEVTEEIVPADIYVINTCAVTAEAEKKSRQAVARVKKQNPDAKIYVCGCASENKPEQFEKEGVVYVSGTALKQDIASLAEKGTCVSEIPKIYEDYGFAAKCRTRAYVKIQDGCNNFCSYCLIPYVRGRSRSRAPEGVFAEVAEAVNNGVKEVVLTGIDISSYGKDIGLSLTALIDKLKDFDVRIRLGSFEVNVIDERLLVALKKLKKFCPHFHLSLQSGSDVVLKSMNRRYTTEEYAEKVRLIRSFFPLAGLTTDIIVGFPTESDVEFKKSLKFIEETGFSDIHCFPYSPRKGTKAYALKPISADVIGERTAALLRIKEGAKITFAERNIGVPSSVLFEDTEGEYTVGYTGNYVKFYKKGVPNGKVERLTATQQFLDGIK